MPSARGGCGASPHRSARSPASRSGWATAQWVSGYPFPNTKYAKHVGLGADGLAYLAIRVLPEEPWLAGLGGIALVLAALLRGERAQRRALAALLLAWLATILGIALSRPFGLGVLFYFSRYFAIVAAVPAIAVALGLARVPRVAAALLLAPVLLVNAQLASSTHARQRAQEEDIRQLHSEPARYVAGNLPERAVVVVEGAGATRFFAPRSMTIVDMLGLNDRAIAPTRTTTTSGFARCWRASRPTCSSPISTSG